MYTRYRHPSASLVELVKRTRALYVLRSAMCGRLVEFARGQGYAVDKRVEMIEDVVRRRAPRRSRNIPNHWHSLTFPCAMSGSRTGGSRRESVEQSLRASLQADMHVTAGAAACLADTDKQYASDAHARSCATRHGGSRRFTLGASSHRSLASGACRRFLLRRLGGSRVQLPLQRVDRDAPLRPEAAVGLA